MSNVENISNVEIIPLEESCIDDIVNISILSFPIAWTKEAFLNELANKFARYVVAVKDDIIIGYGGMWVILDEAHVTNIAVHPEYRGIGAGNLIVEALLDVCRYEKANSMTLEVRSSNEVAQSLYKKYGFVEEGVRKNYYEDNKEDAIIMWKRDI